MATRIKDWLIPYVGWDGIEITNNHVINVLLRKENNLIHINENRELYTDLQLPDWILPDDDFPVWVTTGRILREDWWQQNATIINWKTTSWDYTRLINTNDWSLYVDLGDWVWRLIGSWWSYEWNVKWFTLANLQDLTTGQQILDRVLAWKYAVLEYEWDTYLALSQGDDYIRFLNTHKSVSHFLDDSYSTTLEERIYIYYDGNNEIVNIAKTTEEVSPEVLATNINYTTIYQPLYNWSPTTKFYVDTGLATKQDKLTAWTRITIDQNNVISADVSWVMTYMWNVTDPSQLPSSGQSQWDCRYSESDWHLYAWDWTQWKDIWWVAPNLTNYFNKTIDDSDDITQWSNNLFVTPAEKSRWDNKQDKLVAWENINIDANTNVISAVDTKYTAWDWINIDNNNVITNTAKFTPSNPGWVGQFLKKTNEGYAWADVPWGGGWWGWGGWSSYSAWTWIDITNRVISNTMPFNPINEWKPGQVIKKTPTWIIWAYEEWASGDNNVKFWTIDSREDQTPTATLTAILNRVSADANNWAILNDLATDDIFIFNSTETTPSGITATFFWKKRISNVSNSWAYTVAWEQRLIINNTNGIIFMTVWENPDDSTHTNYISAIWAPYTNAFIPTEPYQPATKQYVDNVAAWWWVPGVLTNNSNGTTTSLSQERAWTQAEYNALVNSGQRRDWIIYNILPDN